MKIALTSCAKLQQIDPQPVWQEILDEDPDVLLLLGDTVYLGHDHHTDPAVLGAELRALYAAQFKEAHFQALLAHMAEHEKRVVAIYDDHDFLGNNRYGGDHDPALREAARQEFVNAFGIKANPDVYRVVRAAPVDIIVLDERYYRSSPHQSADNRDAILGAVQWEWLEQVFRSSTMQFIMVASSSTVHRIGDESWAQYPAACTRLCDLMRGRPGAFIASGDVHDNYLEDDNGVIEIVSSGVARKTLLFGRPLKNYGILTFSADQMRVELRSTKAGSKHDITLDRSRWSLDQADDVAHTGPVNVALR
ncbi:alkaline phosphatase D family protein [Rugamonas aquatica]|uniref:PhoD-like phosphatase metallophosphatase domain-containing protein n=1 Tax=Rugamonas aquatica TaxID=2743357 RepID=A0A6A7N2H9_9BURK|nr:alkaline phosphatase D family protein [Rugamonas aquatica]MQA39130.1 hypothetical protein [Rugamonas aquatica]